MSHPWQTRASASARSRPRPGSRRVTAPVWRAARARGDDRGEGVVSAAIVVLIMAAVGALMWVGVRTMWTNIEQDTNDKISEIGS